ncbi:hypothetical protein H6F74_22510 [Trichocoleus sp. FACHB-90]|uniref:hypothetical protein n=1 Tax=Cyanophyceae TaxID=3028117 RepID=UPI00168519EC|nr:hypothetical protein [Trichocoleus sp. FACHB-90]MBD1928996.1 hypothetical protein [Trichocoleus sp. FACHB-90]
MQAVEEKRHAKLQIKQKAQQLLKEGFKADIAKLDSWLHLPKLITRYKSQG